MGLPSTLSRIPRSIRWLLLILAVAAFFRFMGLHWDAAPEEQLDGSVRLEEHHLHPDERFLTSVTAALELPDSISNYFQTRRSPLNPHNKGFGFFVYGTFPIFVTKVIGEVLGRGGYAEVHIVGRALSALSSLLTIALLYVLGRRLYDEQVALLGAAFLGLAVLPIQQAHFYTVDSMTNVFVLAGLLAATAIQRGGGWRSYVFFGLALGTAMACKVSAFTLSLTSVAAAVAMLLDGSGRFPRPAKWLRTLLRLAIAAGVAFLLFRMLQPYAFSGPGFFRMYINRAWWANMQEVSELVSGARDYPPGHQWTKRTALWFPWWNMVTAGLGPALGLAAWVGWAWAGWQLWSRRRSEHLVPWLWVTVVFFHQGSQWVKAMRYLLPIYPVLALFAAYLLVSLKRWGQRPNAVGNVPPGWLRRGAVVGGMAVLAGTLAWAWAFTAIYRQPHSRIAASRWLYENAAAGATIANEAWDDALPVRLGGRDAFSIYQGLQLHNYAEDTPEKLQTLLGSLEQSDFVVLSSNRLYDSIPRLPMRYPMTVLYYHHLFSGELGFEKVAEFTSYPRIAGIAIPDQWVEEAFSVYDHPRVQIFRKGGDWDVARARELLSDVDWDGISRLWPIHAKGFKSMMLDDDLLAAQRAGGTWSTGLGGLFDESGLSNRYPIVVWVLALVLLGVVVFPISWLALSSLPDGGWLASRTLGLLLTAWLAWMLASLRWVTFTRGGVALSLALIVGLSAVVFWQRRGELLAFLRSRWRLLLVEEVVFWGLFALMLIIRLSNPELWHPARGGEKPMDLAYLNAVVRSEYFPPYDPWFAGGYLNYYYFGFVLTGTLILLTGVVPTIAYNLAVPTFFALTGGLAFVAASALTTALRRGSPERKNPLQPLRPAVLSGVFAALFAVLLGNLSEIRLLFRGLVRLGGGTDETPLGQAAEASWKGLGALARGESIPFPNDWWFWNASRAIPHPQTEPPPITEFPFFTHLFADLHAHLMAMPLALLALVVALHFACRSATLQSTPTGWRSKRFPRVVGPLLADLPALAILSLAVGALWPTNSWDFPTYLFLAGAGILIGELRRGGSVKRAIVGATGRFALVTVAGRALFYPFLASFASAYTRPMLWKGSRTPFDAFLTVHGLFLALVLAFLLGDQGLRRKLLQQMRVVRLRVRHRRRQARLGRLLRAAPGSRLSTRIQAWCWLGLVALALVVAIVGLPVEALLLVLLALAATLLWSTERSSGALRFTCCMVLVALGLTGVVEFVVLQGDIGRMNTVFKLYLQVWLLLSVVGGVSTSYLVERRPIAKAWLAVTGVLLCVALLYPALAAPARIRDRYGADEGLGLDGQAFMKTAVRHEEGGQIELRWDDEAIRWLRSSVEGSPVILEASVPPYRWGSRVSIYTGLPTVLGWDWHQRQQRAVLRNDTVRRRPRRRRASVLFNRPREYGRAASQL